MGYTMGEGPWPSLPWMQSDLPPPPAVEPLDDAPDEGPFLFPTDPDKVYSQQAPCPMVDGKRSAADRGRAGISVRAGELRDATGHHEIAGAGHNSGDELPLLVVRVEPDARLSKPAPLIEPTVSLAPVVRVNEPLLLIAAALDSACPSERNRHPPQS